MACKNPYGPDGGSIGPVTHAVTFDTGAGGSPVASELVEHGKYATKPNNPEKEDCDFRDWYVAAESTEIFDFTGMPINKTTTIYAKWKTEGNLIVTFVYGGNQYEEVEVAKGSTVSEPSHNPPKTGYSIEDWYEDKDFTGKYNFGSTVTEDITLYAKWEKLDYNLEVTDGENGGGTKVAVNGEDADTETTANYEDTITLILGTADEGYEFDKWEVTLGTVMIAGNTFTMPAEDVTVKATWKKIEYTVTVNQGAGGTGSSADKPKANYEDTVTLTEGNPNEGYEFDKWEVMPGTVTIAGNTFTMPAENVIVQATWKKVDYVLEVTDENGSGPRAEVGSAAATTANYMDTVTLIPGTADEGYEFGSWEVASTSGSIPLVAGNTFTMPAEDVTVKAIWKEIKSDAGITIDFEDIKDELGDKEITGPTFSMTGDPGTITVEGKYDKVQWIYDGKEVPPETVAQDGDKITLTLTSAIYGEKLGTLYLTLKVEVDGKSYSKTVTFTVTL